MAIRSKTFEPVYKDDGKIDFDATEAAREQFMADLERADNLIAEAFIKKDEIKELNAKQQEILDKKGEKLNELHDARNKSNELLAEMLEFCDKYGVNEYTSQEEAGSVISEVLSTNASDLQKYYEEKGGTDADFNVSVEDVLGALSSPDAFSKADVVNAAKKVIDDKVSSENTPKTPGEAHGDMQKILDSSRDSLREYYQTKSGKDDFDSIIGKIFDSVHKSVDVSKKFTEDDVMNAAEKAIDSIVAQDKIAANRNPFKAKNMVHFDNNEKDMLF